MTPVVSACIVTYQHARFIGRAIDGALMQKTDFPVEILVGEDESTDGTRQICQDYARRHPGKVQVFLRQRRDVVFIDGLARGSYNFNMTVRAAQGEFIALCEGDDYWTDPEKLQRQVDYLRANPDCVGCFHDAQLVDAEERCIQESYFQSDKDKFNQTEVLDTLLSRQPTCSLVFRKAAFVDPLPAWYLRRPCDLYLDILLTGHGSLGFIRRNMSAYRKHAGGIWSGQREAPQLIELIIRLKSLLADPFFLKQHRDLLLRKIDEYQASLFTRADATIEVARLEAIVLEQTKTMQLTHRECERLQAEAKASREESQRAVSEGQKHIDHLQQQLNAGVAGNQKTVDSLMKQLDCSSAENEQTLVALRSQLDRLATTSQQQDSYISILKNDQERLNALVEKFIVDQAHYVDVINEQTSYIKTLEAQRNVAGS